MPKEDDMIERIWAGRGEGPTMSREEITRALRPRVGRSCRTLWLNLWLYLGALLVTLVLQGMNLTGYRANPTMLVVHAVVLVAALGLAGFGIHFVGQLGRLDHMDESLPDAVSRRLAFFRGKYEAWLWMCAASLLALTWAINTLVDNADGVYRINKPLVFFGTQAVMFFGVYAMLKASHLKVVHELRAVLEDLQAQMTDHTQAVDAAGKRWKRWYWVLVVLLTLLALLGLWLALRGTG